MFPIKKKKARDRARLEETYHQMQDMVLAFSKLCTGLLKKEKKEETEKETWKERNKARNRSEHLVLRV